MNLTLHVWRQTGPRDKGGFETYRADDVSESMSFLDMLDLVNEDLTLAGKEPIAFEHDCREGICGSCGMMINGVAHGPQKLITACQLHMRSFRDGDEIWIEPWRATAFPVMRDLVVDRSSFDRVIQAGGYISVRTG
ncbi:MAG: succinate dehydrogenase/fumarate reductase iron-sulfur subunit, partial [Gemmatimonadales bacterium]